MTNSSKSKSSPSFQDKEERRLIILASMDYLLRFHKIDRMEKYNAMKFYASFLGGGIALLLGVSKINVGIEQVILNLLLITIIVIINLLAMKKLIAVRGASNNIYHEHGRRLRFLLDTHSSDLDEQGIKDLKKSFVKYIDEQKSGPLLQPKSADKFEVYSFLFINVIFSLIYWIPFHKLGVLYPGFTIGCQIFVFGILILGVIYFGCKIISDSSRMPNIKQRNKNKRIENQ